MAEVDLTTAGGEAKVLIAGDWHGSRDWLRSVFLSAIENDTTGIRTILHLGDFGIWGERDRGFLEAADYLCEKIGIERILVTPGNHEDWRILDAGFETLPEAPVPLSASVLALPRGFRFTLGGRSFMSFGGAASIDYQQRLEGFDWFKSEMATEAEAEAAAASGDVDVLLLHEAINGGTGAVEEVIVRNPMGWPAEALAYSAESRAQVTRVWEGTRPKLTFHGHMHNPDEVTLPSGQRVRSLGCDNQAGNIGELNLQDLSWRELQVTFVSARPRRTLNVEKLYLDRPGSESEESN
ncbi:metallophosphoesterase family protein [Subtercola vilae]|nr:metallophosphoesterase [Subtercola vilae]